MAEQTVPNIATLREICHRGKLAKDRRFWYVAARGIAIHITWLLLHTGVSANQVTSMTVVLALVGVGMLAAPPAWVALCGACALLGYHLLDKVDGDVARFRRTYSIVGVYLDEVGHGIALAGLFLGLGTHLAWGAETVERAFLALAAGGFGGVCMVLARVHKNAGFLLYAQYVLVQPALLPDRPDAGEPHPLSREGTHRSRRGDAGELGTGLRVLAWLRDTVLMLADFVIILALVIAGVVVELATGATGFLTSVLVAGALLQGAVLLALVWINCSTNIRSECLRLEALVADRAGHGHVD